MKKFMLLGSLLTIAACTNITLTPTTPSNFIKDGASFYDTCSILKSQYPLNPTSEKESTLDDFTAYFSVGGIVDNHLKSKVPASSSTQENHHKQTRIISQIRRDLFDSSQTKLHANLTLKTLQASPQLSTATLRLGNQQGPAVTGPRINHSLTWPTTGPVSINAHMLDGTNLSTDFTGDWNLFKLLDNAEISKAANGNVILDLSLTSDGIGVQYLARLPETLINWREVANQLNCSHL
jgi:type VI protein secretion system component VasK